MVYLRKHLSQFGKFKLSLVTRAVFQGIVLELVLIQLLYAGNGSVVDNFQQVCLFDGHFSMNSISGVLNRLMVHHYYHIKDQSTRLSWGWENVKLGDEGAWLVDTQAEYCKDLEYILHKVNSCNRNLVVLLD